ncbi:MAG: HlyC/CorC family transporter [Acidobacteriaceae bacterium]|nr:HlyC/CorC family transporter [Acidobacteriaceae bacterium]MBV9778921.1 HlyC/CorC family transporter [Acidobacteriaceae bacterium]
MSLFCLALALFFTCLLGFVSFVQLLYLESLRLIKREVPSLQYFRESLAEKIGLEVERGSLTFSLVKHVSLPLTGVFYFCALVRPGVPHWQSILEAVGLSFLVMLVTTYLIPIFLYRRTTGAWMLRLLPAVKLLAVCASPLTALLRMFQSLVDLDNAVAGETAATDSVEHIEALITAGAEEGILEEEDRKLIHSVVAFGDKSVREVMTPRPNIVAISADKSLEDLRQLVIHEQYSRIPVYEGTIDNVIGFVHVRDMFELDPEDRQSRVLKDLIRPVELVPETKPVSDLLRDMQTHGSHIVIAVDEYGNTAGVATMEDLVEEILGEIRDEHEPDRDVHQESEHVFVAPGSLDLDRLQDLLNFRPEGDTESTTLGGLVAEWVGHVPQVGETVERGGIRVQVLAGNERRVEQVRISRVGTLSPVAANS